MSKEPLHPVAETLKAAEIIDGFLYDHHRININTATLCQLEARVEALVTILVEKGIITQETLEAYQQQAMQRLREAYVQRGMAVAIHEVASSKYQDEGRVEIDCANRVHLCKAACCRLQFALTKEDVEEGIVRWELGQPYMNARTEGYCVHLEREACQCTIHAHRPAICRSYDCRQDQRIWLDFEKHLINPHLDKPGWPRNTGVETVSMDPETG